MNKCENCNNVAHVYMGKCNYCGKARALPATRKEEASEVHEEFTDDNRRELAGFMFVILLFMLLAGGIAVTVSILE